MKNNIYLFEQKGYKTFYCQRPVVSDVSGDVINDSQALLIRLYDKRFGRQTYICTIEEYKAILMGSVNYEVIYNPGLYTGMERNIVLIVNNLPPGTYLFTDPAPGFKQSKNFTDAISAADKQAGDEVIDNKTVHARLGKTVEGRIAYKKEDDEVRLIGK